MRRRGFIGAASSLLAAGPVKAERELEAGGTGSTSYAVEAVIERKNTGTPHAGKVLAAIQPHCDDIPIFAGGTVLKLIEEGYTGVLITMSNDSMAGAGTSIGDIVLKNERDTTEVARRLGLKDAYFLNYPNHNMDGWPLLEMRARLVFLFRLLKVDTVLVYDPAALYERNPDHSVTEEPAATNRAWSFPDFGHGIDSSSPIAPGSATARVSSDCLGQLWRAEVGRFSQAPKPWGELYCNAGPDTAALPWGNCQRLRGREVQASVGVVRIFWQGRGAAEA